MLTIETWNDSEHVCMVQDVCNMVDHVNRNAADVCAVDKKYRNNNIVL